MYDLWLIGVKCHAFLMIPDFSRERFYGCSVLTQWENFMRIAWPRTRAVQGKCLAGFGS